MRRRTIPVLVEKAERLLEFGNLLFGQLVSHGGFRSFAFWLKTQVLDGGGRSRPRTERPLPFAAPGGSFAAFFVRTLVHGHLRLSGAATGEEIRRR
jgi:hypothetical protein